jgi:hypothetical protein
MPKTPKRKAQAAANKAIRDAGGRRLPGKNRFSAVRAVNKAKKKKGSQ